MTKSEIEKLIEYLQQNTTKTVFEDQRDIYCKFSDLLEVLRRYATESEKTCGPDYKAMYEVCQIELDRCKEMIESMKFDMHHNAIEHAHYAGAVAAMETIFGRKFEPQK